MSIQFSVGAVVLVAMLGLVGCGASVSISSTRNPNFRGSVEPIVFVIYEGNTGAIYTVPLRENLHRELRARKIAGHAGIITGAEFNEEQALRRIAHGARSVALIMPVGGTSYDGSLKQILYDVRVFAMSAPGTDEGIQVWRGKVDSRSGAFEFQIRDRLELLAKELLNRLAEDGVLDRATIPAE